MFEKFKVWCMEHNEWEKHEVAIVTNGNLVHILPGRAIPLRKETHKICWNTHKKDKYGNEIYTHDIVRVTNVVQPSGISKYVHDVDYTVVGFKHDVLYCEVILNFDHAQYYYGQRLSNINNDCEIIGNEYPDPELLKHMGV